MKVADKKDTATDSLSFMHLLGGSGMINRNIRSEFDLIALSNEGITKASLDEFVSHLGMSKKAFAENVLSLSVKTLERKKNTDRLDRQTSSHIIEIAKVVEHALDVFGDGEKAKIWLNSENRALNNVRPTDLFYIPTGLQLVDNILGRIEHGVYS